MKGKIDLTLVISSKVTTLLEIENSIIPSMVKAAEESLGVSLEVDKAEVAYRDGWVVRLTLKIK